MPFKIRTLFFDHFLNYFRAKMVSKMDPKITQKSISAPQGLPEAILEPFWSHFGAMLESFVDVFWLPSRAVHNIAKTTKRDDVIALFKVFPGTGESKIEEKASRPRARFSSIFDSPGPSKSLSYMGPGIRGFRSHFGVIFGVPGCQAPSNLEI